MNWISLTADWCQRQSAVHVFRSPVPSGLDEDRLLARLPDYERQRAARLKFASPRRQYLVARYVLRQLLGVWCEADPWTLTFAIGPHGKPRLDRPGAPEFNLSHSGDWVAIALSESRPVGIDVETVDYKVSRDRLAGRYFSPAEQTELSALPESDRWAAFYRGWTCKEAWIKATGRGMGFAVERLTVRLDPALPARLCAIEDDIEAVAHWQLIATAAAPEAPVAVCASGVVEEWRCWDAACLLPADAVRGSAATA
jgi:4'-phosphopantetheinyl transferase